MRTGVAEQIGGRFCVVVHTDGTSEIKELKGVDTVFDEAKGFIECKWLDHVILQGIAPDVALEFLVNDNGYADWNKDPKKVNQIATFLHEGGQSPSHYILGNVVMCLTTRGDEGGEFIGMNETLAKRIKEKNDTEILPKAKAIVPIPEVVPDPEVRILGFNSIAELLKFQRGDKSVRPVEEQIVSGPNAAKES